MKKIFVILLTLLCFPVVGGLKAQNAKPFVIPELKSWQGKNGNFLFDGQVNVSVVGEDERMQAIASQFVQDFEELCNVQLQLADRTQKGKNLQFKLKKNKRIGAEGYEIDIREKSVTVTANEPVGLFWATRSLLQMAEQSEECAIPCGKIEDYPDYAVRGFMIDCGRKFIPLSFLQDYVKIMAYYKMNTFQIHLNDNGFKQFFGHDWNRTYAAFRLECDTYPGLTAQDGYYTKREFIDLQKLAESQYVNIIPEIDAPAHALAFTQYKPEIGSKEYGMDHLDLFNPETYKFMDGLFKEYLEGDEPVFRGKQVHIGTDEYSNKDPKVVEKFRYFTDYYIRYVEKFGKQACVWGALTHAKGETPVKSENVIMSAWYNGYADPKEMVKQGYKLISVPDGLLYIVPKAGYYYDYLNTKHLYENWTPVQVGACVFPEKDPAILGGMFAVWNDHAGNGISTKDIHYRTFPAVQTLAVKMWTGKQTTVPFAEFDQKRLALSEAPAVNQGGRIGKKEGVVFECASLEADSPMPYECVGHKYQVSFDLEGMPEEKGTELFRSEDAVFYLSDPIKGMMGFARDGYLNTFNYSVKKENVKVRVEGDYESTRLYINDKLIEDMKVGKLYFNAGKDSMNYVRTLVFPMEQSGKFQSKIKNFKVSQSL